jgi:riboflavin kinase / FMN adenylyltransferase
MTTRLLRTELHRAAPGRASAFTIGTFDGVHRGHQFLIRLLRQRAEGRGLASGVITLYPHPLTVVRPGTEITYITGLDERIELLLAQSIDAVVPVTFSSELSQVSAEDFVRTMVEELQLRFLLVGPDFALGRGREGSIERLQEIGTLLRVEVEMAPAESEDGHKIGSSDIRAALANGDIERVNELLGRRFSLSGPVVHGRHLGRTIGFPTANIAVAADRALPAYGVYAACAGVNETLYSAAVNIGTRPTVDDGAPTVEAYLLDFTGDIYGRDLRLEFVRRIRPELKFKGLEALKAAIADDVEKARALVDCSAADAW